MILPAVALGPSVLLTYLWRSARARSRRSERLYAKSFHASPTPTLLVDIASGRCIDANAAYCELTGWDRADLVGMSSAERNIVKGAERDAVKDRLDSVGSVQEMPVRIQRKNGETRDALLSAVRVDIDGTPHAMATIVDVTALRRVESAVQESEKRMRDLAEVLDEVFWLTDSEKHQTFYLSPAYERVWGRSRGEVYRDARKWLEAVHPDDRARVLADALPAPTTPREIEFRIVRPDGSERWIHNKSFPVCDAAGRVVRIAGVAADITERRLLEAELQQAQKLESLGRLAGGVAHDFNNLLVVISTNASILREDLPEGDTRTMMGEIEDAVARACGLTRQLLAFSRKQVIQAVVLDLNATVADTRKMLRRMIGEDVALETSLDPELGHVCIDPGQLVQVLMNLAVNARDAMPRGGKLAIETRADGEAVVLVVRDTGTGMTPEIRARIFEPFFTTKEAGKGTGMGLAVVHGIVEQAGGRIEVETAPGAGTTFRILLPATSRPVAAAQSASSMIPRGTERVLVVDDDEHLRHAALRALRTSGYDVREARDAESALDLIRAHALDLLVTDVVMPGMNGRELAEAARARHPELRVLYMSGYTDDSVVRHGVSEGSLELIEKPFRLQDFATKVREVLDAP